MRKFIHAIASIIILSGASAAHAQERGYVGVTFGPLKAGVTNGVGQRVEHNNDVVAFKGYAGYTLNEQFAIEGGYAGTARKPRFDRTQFGSAADPQADMSAVYAALRGKVSVSGSIDMFAKLGVARNHFALAGAGAQDFDVTAVKPMAGVGVGLRVTDKIALTVELEHYGRVREGNRRFVQNRAQAGVQFGF